MKYSHEMQTGHHRDNTLLTLKVAARFIGMSPSFLKTIKNRNEIPFYQLGRRVMFRISDLQQYIDKCRVENTQKGSAQNEQN